MSRARDCTYLQEELEGKKNMQSVAMADIIDATLPHTHTHTHTHTPTHTHHTHTQAVFHFRTIQPPSAHNVADLSSDTLPEGSKVIDDSRTMGTGPFELLIGREFKLSVWEELVRSMRVGEVARFLCPFEVIMDYDSYRIYSIKLIALYINNNYE